MYYCLLKYSGNDNLVLTLLVTWCPTQHSMTSDVMITHSFMWFYVYHFKYRSTCLECWTKNTAILTWYFFVYYKSWCCVITVIARDQHVLTVMMWCSLLSHTRGWSLVMGKNLRLKLSAMSTACSGCSPSSCSAPAFLARFCFPALPAMFVMYVSNVTERNERAESLWAGCC